MTPADEQPKPTTPVLGEWTPVRATAPDKPKREPLSRTQKLLISVVITGAIAVAIIGFTGSYAAVSHLARIKGFGWFASVFPLGVDAGIVAVLALDMVLTGFRMRYAPLRPTAWFLTVATIAFNASAAWGDTVAVGMHAVIPFLFVIVVEAARHAVGRIANIEADQHMESPRLTRWVLAFPSTFRIWRRQRLWELRSYEDVIAIERDAAQYREALRAEHGRGWRRKANADAVLALRLARYGTPITETLARLQGERTAATVRPLVICKGRRGVLLLRVPRQQAERSWASAEPAGPVGERIADIDGLLGASHAPVVYFVVNGSRIKIGTSQNLASRISALSLRLSDVVLVHHGSHGYERELHRRFAEYRVPGTEWFDLTGELATFLAAERGEAGASTPPVGDPSGDSSAPPTGDNSTANRTTTGAPSGDSASDKSTAKSAPARRQKTAPAGGKKATTRRSMDEWVELAGPIFHAEFRRLRRQPTANEFAQAIKDARLGTVSDSTAKNIRAEILDRAELPALD